MTNLILIALMTAVVVLATAVFILLLREFHRRGGVSVAGEKAAQVLSAYEQLKIAAGFGELDFFDCGADGVPLAGRVCRYWPSDDNGRPLAPDLFVSPDDLAFFNASRQRLLSGELDRVTFAYRAELDNKLRHFEQLLCRMPPESGQKDGVIKGFIREVSEREDIRRKLDDATTRLDNTTSLLETVLDNLPVYIYACSVDRDFRYVMCSKRTIHLPADRILGRTIAEIVDNPEIVAAVEKEDRELAAGSDAIERISCYHTPGIGDRTAQVFRKLLRRNDGERLIVTMISDITATERQRAELFRTNAMLSAVLEGIPAWVAVKDLKDSGRYLIWNSAAVRFTGLPAADVIGRTDAELPRQVVANADALRETARLRKDKAFRRLSTETSAAGKTCQLYSTFSLVKSGGSEFELVIRFDVTAARRLRKAEFEKLLLIDAVKIPIMLFDQNHKLLRVNNAAQKIAGIPEERIYSQPCYRSFCSFPSPPEECPVRRALDDLKQHEWSVTLGGRDYQLQAYPILADGKLKYVLKTLVDVTDSNRIRRELGSALEQARESSQVKSRFLGTMSHQLRTPLNAVIGFADLLVSDDARPEERREYSTAIAASGRELLNMVDKVLEFSRNTPDAVPITGPLDLAELLRRVAEKHRPTADSKHLSLKVKTNRLPENLPLDGIRLEEAIDRLIDNAVKFTSVGGVELAAAYIPEAGKLLIAVHDTGVGIPADKLRHVFEPFFQQDVMRDAHLYHGNGLGLALVEKIVRELGGTVSVDSREREGSTFTIEFNRLKPSGNDAAAGESQGISPRTA